MASIRWFQVSEPLPILRYRFDGKNVLFAGKRTFRTHGRSGRFRCRARNLRRITSCAKDCVRPFYLPEDRVVYAKKSAVVLLLRPLTEPTANRAVNLEFW